MATKGLFNLPQVIELQKTGYAQNSHLSGLSNAMCMLFRHDLVGGFGSFDAWQQSQSLVRIADRVKNRWVNKAAGQRLRQRLLSSLTPAPEWHNIAFLRSSQTLILTHPDEILSNGQVHLVRGKDHQDVHPLVGVADQIKTARKPTLRGIGCSNQSAREQNHVLQKRVTQNIIKNVITYFKDIFISLCKNYAFTFWAHQWWKEITIKSTALTGSHYLQCRL